MHQASIGFLCACSATQFLSLYNVIPCRASANGTARVGTKIQGNVAIVEALKSGLVMTPRVTALTKSAIPSTLHTTTAYFDQLYPFHRKRAKGIADTPMRISPLQQVSQKLDLGVLESCPIGKLFHLSSMYGQLLGERSFCCIAFVLNSLQLLSFV